MKEKLERVCNSFKTGVMIWIFAYLLLYVICVYIGDFSAYNNEVMKLLNIENFIAQLLIAGALYITLELVLLHFVDNVLKYSEQDNNAKTVTKYFILSIVIIVVLCLSLYVIKEKNIVNKNVMKLMMTIIGLKAIVFVINQMINTSKYNKKLKEKINKKT